MRAVLAQQQPDPLPVRLDEMPYGDPGAVDVIGHHPFGSRGVVLGTPLHQDVRHVQFGGPAALPRRAAGGDEQAVDAVGEHLPGLGPLLVGAVLRDAEHEADAPLGGGVPRALDHLGVVVVGGRNDQAEHPLAPAPGGRLRCPGSGGLRQQGAAVHPLHEAAFGEQFHVAAHGDGRDTQLRGHLRDPDRTALTQPPQDLLMPFLGVHVFGPLVVRGR